MFDKKKQFIMYISYVFSKANTVMYVRKLKKKNSCKNNIVKLAESIA